MQGPYPADLRPPIFAIDPGTVQSGYVVYDPDTHTIIEKGILPNCELAEILQQRSHLHSDWVFVIEMIQSYGMPVGAEVFETVVWIGRFTQIVESEGMFMERIFRPDVKRRICKNVQAKDSNIRQAIIDRFPRTGGGKIPQIGIKKQPGPLYGVGSHVMSALAVALTYHDMDLD